MQPKTCGECACWARTLPGRRKDDAYMERVCIKGSRCVCRNMLADAACFEPVAGDAFGPVINGADICGDCEEWARSPHGRRREDGETYRLCSKGGRPVSRTMRADPFCFIRRAETVM
ncbi:hypothetical protein DesfrDRAFT_0304 [Solidesulfovibrio fructosivorans JJ]]|uniref:Uncharacterized protein n=1 Tax=Solidesulfovibrio fructosivorans JJ] TaxID=596151 RepID=E1JRQ5_SOLFR|nr:hypothetical protein [Solidesulfovibrio fructosivorans]EFL53256.1 hypothetical protein DesfrDRAFT_0304 [Solidesulfovibrio fructosivorans JJ]]